MPVICAYGIYRGVQLFCGKSLYVAENYRSRTCQLVAKEFTEVTQMHAAFCGIGNGNHTRNFKPIGRSLAHGAHHVGELADTRWLNQDTVGGIFIKYLCEGCGKVTDKTAADAA